MIRRAVAVIILWTIVTTMAFGCVKNNSEPMTKSYFEFFDTVSTVSSYAGDSKEEFEANCEALEELFEEYHRAFDIYYEYSGINNLRTVNKNAGIAPVNVDGKIIDMLEYALDIGEKTSYETNILMGAVTSLWHKAAEDAGDNGVGAFIPDPDELRSAAGHISPELLVIDRNEGTVYITDSKASLDVGAVGKGYAVDKAAELLLERGAEGYVINVGGNIRTVGSKPDGEGWVTGIRNPKGNTDDPFAIRIEIKDMSCVTSGDYERYFTYEGKKYHHIIDKDTLFPSEHFSSVTVLSKDSGLCDTLSTALFCMSYEDGVKLLEGFSGVEVLWIYGSGEMKMTEGFAPYVVK